MNPIHTPIRFRLLRWHRRVGLWISAFVLILAVTGLLLNHTEELSLDRHYVQSEWLLDWYGIEPVQAVSYPVEGLWISELNGGIYLQERLIEQCPGGLAGAASLEGELLVACRNAMLLLTADGRVIERIDATLGLPVPVEHLARTGDLVMLASAGGYFGADLDQLRFESLEPVKAEIIRPAPAPTPIVEQLQGQAGGHSIHWERVLLDLHSGRILGRAGVYIFDLAAILLIFLAISGFYYWASKPHARR